MLEVVGTPICSPQTLTAPCAIEVWPRIEPRSREANSNALACWAVVVLALWNCGSTRRQAALGRVFTLDRINQNEITRNESKTPKRPSSFSCRSNLCIEGNQQGIHCQDRDAGDCGLWEIGRPTKPLLEQRAFVNTSKILLPQKSVMASCQVYLYKIMYK